jgi:methionine aminotransferase
MLKAGCESWQNASKCRTSHFNETENKKMATFNGNITSKLPHTGTSIFAVMSALATEKGAINLSQGFPDFPISEELIALVNQYMKKGFNQYAPMQGLPRLREVIAEKTLNVHGYTYNPDTEINITAGATQGIFSIITAMVHEGDEVIIIEPAYDSYIPAVLLQGGLPKYVSLRHPEYTVDWAEVQKLITRNTRMIIINSPHNPTGSILKAEDMKALEKITRNTDIMIISDEVYEHLIFDGEQHESVSRYPGLAERSFVVSSFGKTFHATGWKMGYVQAPANLMAEFRKSHQFIVFTCNTPIQHALADFMSVRDNWIHLPEFYSSKRDHFENLIKGSRFIPIPSRGTYFQLLDYSKISDEDEVTFAKRLTIEHGIASIPVSVFYHKPVNNHTLRFCFAKQEETMEKAAEILCKI